MKTGKVKCHRIPADCSTVQYLRWSLRMNFLAQTGQEKFFSPVWVRRCLASSSERANRFPQFSHRHGNGLSPATLNITLTKINRNILSLNLNPLICFPQGTFVVMFIVGWLFLHFDPRFYGWACRRSSNSGFQWTNTKTFDKNWIWFSKCNSLCILNYRFYSTLMFEQHFFYLHNLFCLFKVCWKFWTYS